MIISWFLHFLAGVLVFSLSYRSSPKHALAFVGIAAIMKELYDVLVKPQFDLIDSTGDLFFTMLGGTIIFLILKSIGSRR